MGRGVEGAAGESTDPAATIEEGPNVMKFPAWLAPAVLALTLAGTGQATAQDATPAATPAGGARIFALPGERIFPEGVAYQEATNDFFVGSLVDGTISRGNVDTCEADLFIPGGEGQSAVSMKVDDKGPLYAAG